MRVTTGDGTLGSTDPATLSALIHAVQDYSISSSNALVPYQATFQFLIDSSTVSSTYALREVGLICKLGTGPETLVYYSYTTGAPDTITPSGGASAVIDFNSLTITFSNTPNTTATLTAAVPPALHAITHLHRTDGSSTDPLPTATNADVGLVPVTPNDASKVLVGTATASWASAPRIVGEIIDFAGATPPPGWLICDGAGLSTTGIYAALFSVIGYSYGGSGGTFNLPDCRGRTTLGAGLGAGLTNRALGSSGGEEKHSLTIAELPAHNHALTDPGHIHSVSDPAHSHGLTQSAHSHGVNDPSHAHSIADPGHVHSIVNCVGQGLTYQQGAGSGFNIYNPLGAINTSVAGTGIGIYGAYTGIWLSSSNANVSVNAAGTGISILSRTTGITMGNTGSNSPLNVMQPYLTFNKLIKF